MFAKLFEIDGLQVLLRKDNDEEGCPILRMDVEHGYGFGSTILGFGDNFMKRDTAFDNADEELIRNGAYAVWNVTGKPDL